MTGKKRKSIAVISILLSIVLVLSVAATGFGQPNDLQITEFADGAEPAAAEETAPADAVQDQDEEINDAVRENPRADEEPGNGEEPSLSEVQRQTTAAAARKIPEIEVKWGKGGALSSSVEVGFNDSLRISIPQWNGTGDADKYKFVVTYANGENNGPSGFKVINSGKFIAGSPIGGKPSFVYEIEEGSVTVDTSMVFEADPKSVYPNESMRAEVKLYRVSGENGDELVAEETATLDTYFLTAGLASRVALKAPVSITEGASAGLYQAGYAISSLKTAGVEGNGGVWSNYYGLKYVDYDKVEVTLDFSKVMITAGGHAHTYQEWQDPEVYGGYGFAASPVAFFRDENGTDPITADDPLLSYKQEGADRNADYNPLYYPFYIKTTADFKGAGTTMDFSGMKVARSMEINGHRYSFEPVQGTTVTEFADFNDKDIPLVLAAIPSMMVIKPAAAGEGRTMMRAAVSTSAAPYLLYNSAQYQNAGEKTKHLYYQELFKTEFVNPGEAAELTLTFGIPQNVKVTHVRIPALSENNVYESVTINGVTKPAPTDANYETIEVPGQDYGQDLAVTIKGMKAITSASGRPVEYPKNLLQFVGVTNETLPAGAQVTFALKSAADENGGPLTLKGTSSVKTTVTNEYWVDVYTEGTTLAFAEPNKIGSPLTSVEKGDSFYLTTQFFPSHYPYGSTLRSDVSDPVNTTLLKNPVVYFILPEGMEADLENVSLFKNTTGSRGFKLLGDPSATLNYTAKSLGTNSEGREVIEIKIHGAAESDDVWILGHYASRLRVSVPVKMPLESEADYIEMTADDALIGTWGTQNARTFSGGAGGMVVSTGGRIPGGAALSGGYAVKSNNARTTQVTLTSSKNAQVYAAVRTDAASGRYQSYSSNDASSFPQVRAGSKEEQFLVHIYNGTGKALTDAEAYFLLPAVNKGVGNKWRTMLTGQPVITADGANYKLYYTTEELLTGSNAFTLGEMKALGSWKEAPGGAVPDGDLENVTGFRFVFPALSNKEQFRMTAKFGVPAVEEGKQPEYGATAVGQMLFDLSDELKGENANTAAVKLRKTDAPVVKEPDGAGERDIPAETTVEMHSSNADLPAWDSAIVYDDFSKIAMDSVKVAFVPEGGTVNTVDEFTLFTNEAYATQERVPGLDIPYAQGARSRIKFEAEKAAEDYVNTAKAGVYTITYLTREDDDRQATKATRIIRVERPENNLASTDAEAELFMDDAVPEGFGRWEAYFRSLVSITEGGQDATALAAADMDGFDPSAPGTYRVTFSYTNMYEYTAVSTVSVTVKYRGTVSGTVSANGQPVVGAVIYAEGLEAPLTETDENGGYRFEARASKEEPEGTAYTLRLDEATLPDGVKHPATRDEAGGTANAGSPHPVHNFTYSPVTIAVQFDSGAAYRTDRAKLVVDGEKVESQPVGGAGEYLFAPREGEGWFDPGAGEYRVAVLPNEGMAEDIDDLGDDFGPGEGQFLSDPLTVASQDIYLRALAPMIEKEPDPDPADKPYDPGQPPADPGETPDGGTAQAAETEKPEIHEAGGAVGETAQGAPAQTEAPLPEREMDGTPGKTPAAGAQKNDERPAYEEAGGTWSLANLILMIAGLACAAFLLVKIFSRRKGNENAPRRRRIPMLVGAVLGIASLVTFIATQDMSARMAAFDPWSWLFAVIAAAQGIMAWLAFRKKENTAG